MRQLWIFVVLAPIWLLIVDCLLRVRRVFKLMEADMLAKREKK